MWRPAPGVFKPNDIRGTYPDQLDERFAYLLGRALPQVFSAAHVAVGHDARLSSPALYAALVSGLREGGAQVGALGMCPTELLYYVVGSSTDYDLAAMVTASHNPPQFNGFKFWSPRGGLQDLPRKLRRLAETMASSRIAVVPESDAPRKGVCAEQDYVDFAVEKAGRPDGADRLKVVVDAGNGVAGLLWDRIREATGVRLVRMNFKPDGNFPAHLPDTSQAENLIPLRERVLKEGAGLGLAYDGDADRVAVVLPDGHVMDGSETAAVLCQCLARLHRGWRLAVSMVLSRRALDFLCARGLEPVLVPVGHAKVKHAMRGDPGLAFAAEASGHYYYRDFFCCDSAAITTLLLLRMAARGELQEALSALPPPWHGPEREPTFPFERREDALSACNGVAESALSRFPDAQEIMCEKAWKVLRHCHPDDIQGAEGVRVDYPTWWFCVRPSGTEPKARLTVEARAREEMHERVQVLSSLFGTAPHK